jgi:hypothetical protein
MKNNYVQTKKLLIRVILDSSKIDVIKYALNPNLFDRFGAMSEDTDEFTWHVDMLGRAKLSDLVKLYEIVA